MTFSHQPRLCEGIPWLRRLIPSLHLSPSTCRGSPWLLPPSAPPGSLIPPPPPWSVVTLPALRTCEPSAALCLSTPMASAGSSFPPGSTSVLGHSGSTSKACHHGFALVSSACGVAQFHRLSVCAVGSPNKGSISDGHPWDVAWSPSWLCRLRRGLSF